MITQELQLEGLVGPTHHYAGLGLGNLASITHADSPSNPRAAALQSLEKMRWLIEQGVPVAVMPPQTRPRLDLLARLGFSGSVGEQLQQAANTAPSLLRAIWSASSMWTANAATVCASADAADGRVHLSAANLFSSLHRMIEAREAAHYLRQIFPEPFMLHDPLPVTARLADEGAANHMRLCNTEETEALHLFIYGASPPDAPFPARFQPRQYRAASEAVAAQHQLDPSRCLFLQQHPAAIDAGVFHHDVIGMSHRHLCILHEAAFINRPEALAALRTHAPWLELHEIRASELSLADAVATYFFNAQIISLAEGGMAILFPQECADHAAAHALAESLTARCGDIRQIAYLDLRESMRNGGGPACLRLRVPLTPDELKSVHGPARLNQRLYLRLRDFIATRYRDYVIPSDTLDADFAQETLQYQRDLLQLLQVSPYQP